MMLELIQKIKDYTEAGIILEHMELFDELMEYNLEFFDTFTIMEKGVENMRDELDKKIIKDIKDAIHI